MAEIIPYTPSELISVITTADKTKTNLFLSLFFRQEVTSPARDIRNNPELDDEERKHMLKFNRIIRTNRLYKAAKRLPERPRGCYESDEDE
ncbi:hypothetical protein ECV0102_02230 [Enterobacter cloacae]|nr:hypothetical protein ECV0102_02230 [Enterobacter cloacae]